MKSSLKYITINLIGLISFSMIQAAASTTNFYADPKDEDVVNAIKKISDISEKDVKRFKLARLGKLEKPVAGMIGTAAMAAGGFGVSQAHEKVTKLFSASTLAQYLGRLAPTSDNKIWWALAGAIGLGAGAYRVLYPRLKQAILAKVNRYVEFCESLDIYKNSYADPIHLNELGLSAGESMWVASNIARVKGIQNLIEQGKNAVILLDPLDNTEEVQALRGRLSSIQKALAHNLYYLNFAAQQEWQQRVQYASMNIQGAQQQAQLQATKAQEGALKATKWAMWINTADLMARRTVQAGQWVYHNWGKISATAGAAMLAGMWAKWQGSR